MKIEKGQPAYCQLTLAVLQRFYYIASVAVLQRNGYVAALLCKLGQKISYSEIALVRY